MALSEAIHNITDHYVFHWRVRGGRPRRLAYLTLYYAIFVLFRWGDRYGRALNWLKALGLSDLPAEVVTPDGVRLRLDLHTAFDPLYSILHDRDYDLFPALALKPGHTVIDTGANVGVYTTLAAKRVGDMGCVVAIEPHPGNFALLSGNIERNGFRNVRLVQAAAGEREGATELFLHERCINHSLVRVSERSVKVALTTIDAVTAKQGLPRVDFLKIDTEGNVPAILRGAAETIERHRPYIMFERDTRDESEGLAELFKRFNYLSRETRCFTYAWHRDKPAVA